MKDKSYEVLKTFDKFWDTEARYLKYKSHNPTELLGDMLQVTGIVLRALSYMYERTANDFTQGLRVHKKLSYITTWIERLLDGLVYNELKSGLVPRSVSFKFECPQLDERQRWERILFDNLYNKRKIHYWVRTDVSKSQVGGLCFGLDLLTKLHQLPINGKRINTIKQKANRLLEDIVLRVTQDNWKVKNLARKTTKDGRFRTFGFFPLGGNATRMLMIDQILTNYDYKTALTWLDNKLIKFNLQQLCNFHWWQNADANDEVAMSYLYLTDLCPDYLPYSINWYEAIEDYCGNYFFKICSGTTLTCDDRIEMKDYIDRFNLDSQLRYVWKTDNANSLPIHEGSPKDINFLRYDVLIFNELYLKKV